MNMKKNFWIKLVLALIGILFVGVGIGFNAESLLGNDPVALLYDGVRNALSLPLSRLGMISNIVNVSIIVLVFFIGRHYVNIGTIVYILPLGTFVNLGTFLFPKIFVSNTFLSRGIGTFFGCLFIYVGVSIFISVDIGLDPFTGMVMTISDHIPWKFAVIKICFDFLLILIGFLLGGKVGVITFITALSAGPSIQFFTKQIKMLLKKIKLV
jgi:uncharacterized membrane protein YczE